jgi:hypothetical protein
MKEPGSHLSQDLKALRYLDALDAGDLEAVAALWEEASRNPELERTLAELDSTLFVENRTANADAGAEGVSGLLPKPLPARRRRWAAWVGVGGAVAAACVLAALAWSNRDSKPPEQITGTGTTAQQAGPSAPHDFVGIPEQMEARRIVDGTEMLTFRWPVPVTSAATLSASIPPDLLD